MNRVKLIVFLVVVFFSGTGNVNGQEKNPQTVIIEIYPDAKGMDINFSLLITTPTGDSYEIPMETRTLKNKKESTIKNSKILQKEIDKWKKEGYIVDEVSGSVFDSFMIIMSKD